MSELTIGPLEAAVLKHLWSSGPGSVKDLHRTLGRPRRVSLNTVQSAMDRLYRKDLLARTKVGHAYVYEPAVTRQELGMRLIRQAVAPLAQEPSLLINAAVDYAEREGDGVLEELEALVAERLEHRRRGEEDHDG